MQPVPEHVAHGGQDVVAPFQAEQEETRIEKGSRPPVTVPVVLGQAHPQVAAEPDGIAFFAEDDAMEMGGHDRIGP